MPPRVTKPAAVKVATTAALTNELLTSSFEMRGVTYRLQELDISDYDKLVVLCTATTTDGAGNEVETTDESLLLRMMIEKSLVEPKWKDVVKGTRLVRQLEREVRDLHFGLEPVKRSDEDDEKGDADEDSDTDDDDPNASAG